MYDPRVVTLGNADSLDRMLREFRILPSGQWPSGDAIVIDDPGDTASTSDGMVVIATGPGQKLNRAQRRARGLR